MSSLPDTNGFQALPLGFATWKNRWFTGTAPKAPWIVALAQISSEWWGSKNVSMDENLGPNSREVFLCPRARGKHAKKQNMASS